MLSTASPLRDRPGETGVHAGLMPPQPIPRQSPVQEEAPIRWDRTHAALSSVASLDAEPSPSARCLWTRGFIANRRELIGRTGLPEGSTDADLAARLYQEYGREAARQIAGPFTWVLWDEPRRCLLAVRDRIGIHGLYYAQDDREIRLDGCVELLLPSCPSVGLNLRAVAAQVRGQGPAAGESFFREVHAVEPGAALILAGNRIETWKYWEPHTAPVLDLPDAAAYAGALREVLLPIAGEYAPEGLLGVTLSGGLDSTCLAAALREAVSDVKLIAFTWIAPELPEADESVDAVAAATKLGCPVVTIPADQCWPLRTVPGIRPNAGSPFFNFYTDLWDATFRAVRERGVGHLWSGLGGDHLFGGNVFSYPDLLLTGRWRTLVSGLVAHWPHSELGAVELVRRTVLGPIRRNLLPSRRAAAGEVPWLGERLRGIEPTPEPILPRGLLPGRRDRLRQLRDPLLAPIACAITEQAARHGVELRHPLLDHRLFELAASLPSTQTFSAGRRKEVMRSAFRGRLPQAVVERWGKVHPAAIAERGLRERERSKIWSLMTGMRAAEMGFVDERRLRQAYSDYLTGTTRSALFWHTLTLEVWLRRYFS